RAKAAGFVERRRNAPADGRLPGRQRQDPENPEIRRPVEIVLRPARHRQHFTVKETTEQRNVLPVGEESAACGFAWRPLQSRKRQNILHHSPLTLLRKPESNSSVVSRWSTGSWRVNHTLRWRGH